MTVHPHFRRLHHLLYRTGTGEVFACETSPSTILPAGIGSISVPDEGAIPTGRTHRVDVTAIPNVLIALTAEERAEANRPASWEVVHQVSSELGATDQFTVADRPLQETSRSAWESYRQTLRDLSKFDPARGRVRTIAEMVQDWPLRPDGADPISHLRSRI